MLSDLPERDKDLFDHVGESMDLRRKALIWEPGDSTSSVFLVRAGIVKLSKTSDEGRELTLGFFTRDQFLGELGIVSDAAHDTIAEAYEDTQLFRVPKDDFVRVMMRHPPLALRMVKLVGERRQRLENRVESLLFKSAHARLAGLFLDLVRDFGVRDSRGHIVNLKLTHKEIANLIGATRETVSFAILDMRRDGLILTEGKRVIMVDELRLRHLRDS
ncbi:MAG: Crp/Fnr family transcriptional regulator [Deltaproteobacteria bacterium]|nr:Crp/Fnr family transcriptional regulator [Deltaproteobacteria bacterium]